MTEAYHLLASLYQNFYAISSQAAILALLDKSKPVLLPGWQPKSKVVKVQIRHVDPATGRKDRTEFAIRLGEMAQINSSDIRDIDGRCKGKQSKEKPGLVKHNPLYFSPISFAISLMTELQQDNLCFEMQMKICKKDLWTWPFVLVAVTADWSRERNWTMQSMRIR